MSNIATTPYLTYIIIQAPIGRGRERDRERERERERDYQVDIELGQPSRGYHRGGLGIVIDFKCGYSQSNRLDISAFMNTM